MIHYHFSYQNPHKHFIDIELSIDSKNEQSLVFQLPAWRPGRYELANFSKNIKSFQALDENNQVLAHKKITKDSWQVSCKNSHKVTIRYSYYANVLDAGSTYLDQHQLYVNPVNCCMYVLGRENESCYLSLDIPNDYQLACGMKRNAKGELIAKNFDQLAESPFIASNSLVHDEYQVDGITFHLWIQGKCHPNLKK